MRSGRQHLKSQWRGQNSLTAKTVHRDISERKHVYELQVYAISLCSVLVSSGCRQIRKLHDTVHHPKSRLESVYSGQERDVTGCTAVVRTTYNPLTS